MTESNRTLPTLVRVIALAAASGSRSQLGAAALAWTAQTAQAAPGRTPGHSLGARVSSLLAQPRTRNAVTVASAGELVGDKLPKAPSRLSPPGLAPRIACGAVGATVLAHRSGESQLAAGIVGAVAATAASFAGVRWRAAASRRFGRDLPGAVIEDGVALLLAVGAVAR